MNPSLRRITILCCLAIFLIGCRSKTEDLKVGDDAKDFRLDSLTHQRFYLNQQKGKVVVLVFWTTWCNICKTELSELKSLKDNANNDKVVVAAICTDPENVNEVKQIAESLNIDYPVLLDKGHAVADKYRVSVYPMTIIIDQKGVISFIREGYNSVTRKQFRDKISSLLVFNEIGV